MATLNESYIKWIRADLDGLVHRAQEALEEFTLDSEAQAQIEACGGFLHQLFNTLQLLQLFGVAMLVEEIGILVQALGRHELSREAEAAEALMLALARVPEELDRIQSGSLDSPLNQLARLNDLRACRDAPLVTELSLFGPDLEQQLLQLHDPKAEANGSLPLLARRLRPQFHRSLLMWFRQSPPTDGIRQVRQVFDELSEAAGLSLVRWLFQSAAAMLEAILLGGLESTVAIKRLMARVDQEIKRVIEQGEGTVAETPHTELFKNLLFYVSQSTSEGEARALAIREHFELTMLAPVEEGAESAGLSQGLMDSVSQAVQEDLARIKEGVDDFLREESSDVTAIAQDLGKLADTLGMLGLGDERQQLKKTAAEVASWQTDAPPDDPKLLDLAERVLAVESAVTSLSYASGNQVQRQKQLIPARDPMLLAVVRECLEELVQVRVGIEAFLSDDTDKTVLNSPMDRLSMTTNVLVVARMNSVAALTQSIRDYIEHRLLVEGVPQGEELNRMADGIASMEYLMESILQDLGLEEKIIGHARQAMQDLRQLAPVELPELSVESEFVPTAVVLEAVISQDEAVEEEIELEAVPKESDTESGQIDESLFQNPPSDDQADTSEVEVSTLDPVESPLSLFGASDKEAEAGGPVRIDQPTGEQDSEILEIFQEEALEELVVIQELAPQWIANKNDQEALTRIRRSFHTLKGSSRLVGLERIGDFSWALENLLNKVIEGGLRPNDSLDQLLQAALVQLPDLVQAELKGEAPSSVCERLIQRASVLADGAEPDDEITLELPEDWVEPKLDTDEPEEQMSAGAPTYWGEDDAQAQGSKGRLEFDAAELQAVDDALNDRAQPKAPIEMPVDAQAEFISQAQGWLDQVASFLEQVQSEPDPLVQNELLRPLGQLTALANKNKVLPMARLTGAAASFCLAMRDRGLSLQTPDLELLQASRVGLAEMLGAINVIGAGLPDWRETLVELQSRQSALEAEHTAITEFRKSNENETTTSNSAQDAPSPASGRVHVLESSSMSETTTTDDTALEDIEGEDQETLEIFLEEAQELSESMEGSLQEWMARPDGTDELGGLKRVLHTLKGSSRLAGVMQIGDLSHAYESFFMEIEQGKLELGEEVLALARQVADHLMLQIETLGKSGRVPPSRRWIQALEGAKRGEHKWQGSLSDVKEPPPPDEVEPATDLEGSVEPEPPIAASEFDADSSVESRFTTDFDPDSKFEADFESDSKFETDFEPDSRFDTKLEPSVDEGEFDDSSIAAKSAPMDAVVMEKTGSATSKLKREIVRVRADQLDRMVNHIGEINIYRTRLDQQASDIDFNLMELGQTVERLRGQLRQLEMETEAQILYRYVRADEGDRHPGVADNVGFDPLELDRFSTIQQVSRSLAETVNDLLSLRESISETNRTTGTLLLQQSRLAQDLQEGLLHTRMISFAQTTTKLKRLVRQTAGSLGKDAILEVDGERTELDRTVLDRITAPLEHILRNAIAHGIEPAEQRIQAGKLPTGKIRLGLAREGKDIQISIIDDGAGINLEAVRRRALERGLMNESAQLSDNDLIQFLLEPGFTTAAQVTQVAGRGVGMDVVASEVKQLGGTLGIQSKSGQGTRFDIRLPLALSLSEALLVRVLDDVFAIPHASIEGVMRLPQADLSACYRGEKDHVTYAGNDYRVQYLGEMLGFVTPDSDFLSEHLRWYPLLLVRHGEQRMAIQVDQMLGSREIVVKPVGRQLGTVRWITGGTILGDGRVALILDVAGLVRLSSLHQDRLATKPEVAKVIEKPTIMVVDDSITVRKVTSRLLDRNNMNVVTAKDGVDAIAVLQETIPHVMLLDVEMPRMDGYELTQHIRNDPELRRIPIIMITSRSGEKHRQHALDLGVNIYLGKPYQEAQLLESIRSLLPGGAS